MAAPTTTYETLYGVGLLDDIHNYFPAILYDSSRFRTTQDLLHYIQMSVRHRFDLFSFGQRAYINNHLPPPDSPPRRETVTPTNVEPATPPQQVTTDLSGNVQARQPPPAPSRRTRRRSESPPTSFAQSLDTIMNQLHTNLESPQVETVVNFNEEDIGFQAPELLHLVNLLSGLAPSRTTRTTSILPPSLFGGGSTQRIILRNNDLFTDVVVNATQEQIDAATSRTFPTGETPCSICQDNIATNQMARQLNHCHHMFHISCIDEWFSRDVHCPVCRHDIRDINAPQDIADTRHP